jgi:hypothetical protein
MDGQDGADGQFSSILTTVSKTGTPISGPTYTPLDLTTLVNKLTAGYYTLADGTEGQIMYLVRQFSPGYVNVRVANTNIDGTAGTNVDLSFVTNGTGNFITLLFTDGAWSQSGGEWSF